MVMERWLSAAAREIGPRRPIWSRAGANLGTGEICFDVKRRIRSSLPRILIYSVNLDCYAEFLRDDQQLGKSIQNWPRYPIKELVPLDGAQSARAARPELAGGQPQ
jgi:hypothetical protein